MKKPNRVSPPRAKKVEDLLEKLRKLDDAQLDEVQGGHKRCGGQCCHLQN